MARKLVQIVFSNYKGRDKIEIKYFRNGSWRKMAVKPGEQSHSKTFPKGWNTFTFQKKRFPSADEKYVNK